MTIEFVVALALQIAALTVLCVGLRGQLLTHIGALFAISATIYHGLGEVLIRRFPGENPYRASIGEADVDRFVLWISAAILIFVVVYLAVLGDVRHLRYDPGSLRRELRSAGRFYDWRVMMAATTPAFVLTLLGQGALAPDSYIAQAGDQSALSQVVGGYLLFGTTMAGFSLIVRFGRRLLVPVVLVQGLALAVVGVRIVIVVGAITLLHAMMFYGLGPSRRQVFGGVALVLILGVTLTSAREQVGREEFAENKGPMARTSGIVSGLTGIGSQSTRDALRMTAGYRLDGNSFGTQAMLAMDRGAPPLGLTPVKNAVLLAVPSALDPEKLSRPPEHRSEKLYAQLRLGLPVRDILYTQLGGTVVYGGMVGLLFAAAIVAVGIASLDRWLRIGRGPYRLLLSIAATMAACSYQGSWQHWTLAARSVVLLLVAVAAIRFVQHAAKAGPAGSNAILRHA